MRLISQLAELKAVSGGYNYSYDEFVTTDKIFYQSVFSAVQGGFLGCWAGAYLGLSAGTVVLGVLGGTALGYVGYNYNDYADIEPDTWITWDVTVV